MSLNLSRWVPRRRSLALSLTAAAVAGAVVMGGAVPASQARVPADPSDRFTLAPVPWAPCFPDAAPEEGLPPLDCATVEVPLSYDDPDGPTTPLAVYRRPASDGRAERGDLFTNPGGPGGDGIIIPLVADFIYTPDVLAAYNVVGVDPRGVAGSAQLQCFPDNTSLIEFFGQQPATTNTFPRTDEEWAQQFEFVRGLNDACDMNAGPVIDHMSTANLARDISVLSRAEGNRRINFAGYSYGTYVAATITAMLPHRAGRIVADGAIDPVGYATGRDPELPARLLTTWGRFNGAEGGAKALDEFFRLCDEAGAPRCAFAGDSKARFEALTAALREQPLGVALDDRQVLAVAFSALYDVAAFPSLAALLAELEVLVGGGVLLPVDDGEAPPDEAPEEPVDVDQLPYLGPEAFWGVVCGESVNPVRFSTLRAGTESATDQGIFGSYLNAAMHPCVDWRGVDDDAFQGPFATRGRGFLVVNPRFDPITPLVNAEILQDLWRGSTLVTYEGWGHTAGGNSTCVDGAVAQYLLSGRIKGGRDISCPVDPDVVPFPEIPAEEDVPEDATAPGTAEDGQESVAALAEGDEPVEVIQDALEDVADVAEAQGDTERADRVRARAALLSVTLPSDRPGEALDKALQP